MHDSAYLNIVDVACYALEHGFTVRYVGRGSLVVELCNADEAAAPIAGAQECNTEVN